jgi:protease-4
MNFGKTFLAALLAVVVGFGVVIMLWTMIIVGMVSALGSSPAAVVPSGSVLRLNLGSVSDSPAGSPFEGFDVRRMAVVPRLTLLNAVRAIQAAAEDDRIEGIYINFDEQASVSLAALEELRTALEGFRESGKFVLAYEEYFGQAGYWFSSVADEVYTNPAGGIQWTGLAARVMFYKGLLDKLGVEPVVVRHGSFKSAVEPFILDKMSPENRLQYEKMTGTVWGMMLEQTAASRGLEPGDLQRWADDLAIDSPAAALEKGLVDSLWFEDQVMDRLSRLAGMGEGEDPKIVTLGDYASQVTAGNLTSKNKIALIYAEGQIVSGSGANGEVGSEAMIEKIRKARKDEGTVGVVLRINSPGGSALASDVIWRELELLKAEKPVVVSMGELAASGGYWIASGADAIYADRSTLTGSIGVFGVFANVGGALKDKLGVTTDAVTTGRWADIGSPFRAPAAAELAYIQKGIEDVYSTFLDHVSTGRNMTTEAVDAIGQGRVWAGGDALEIGLIDGYGGLVDALALAADRVGVADDFRVWEVTDELSPFDALFSGLSASVRGSVREWALRDELGAAFDQYEYLRSLSSEGGVQARLPYVVDIR